MYLSLKKYTYIYTKKIIKKKKENEKKKKLTNCEILLSTGLVLLPRKATISRFFLRRTVIHRLDFVRLIRIASLREIREKCENGFGDGLILARIIPREESSSAHQRKTEDIRYILATNTAQTLEQNDFAR